MSHGAWRYILASVPGTSHDKTGTPCQDASACEIVGDTEQASCLVAVVADGAGSARLAEVGSSLACKSLVAIVTDYIASGGAVEQISEDLARSWLQLVQAHLRE